MQRNEQRLTALRKLGTSVAPLKLRRLPPGKATPALSLCDWADREVSPDLFRPVKTQRVKKPNKNWPLFSRRLQDVVRRGEMLNLKSNVDHKNWVLQTSAGKTKTLPGACFMIPPPNAEALDKVDRYTREM